MKICSIQFKDYQQFRNTSIDFTNPQGEPLSKVCFIGRNGTGKSTILRQLMKIIPSISNVANAGLPYVSVKFLHNNRPFYFISCLNLNSGLLLNGDVEDDPRYKEYIKFESDKCYDHIQRNLGSYFVKDQTLIRMKDELLFRDNSTDLIVYSPAESGRNDYLGVGEVPQTTLDRALTLFKNFPFRHTVSDSTVKEFWNVLIFLIKNREEERQKFENLPENLLKTKGELLDLFERANPEILVKVAELWNKILNNAGLEFDITGARNPVQLTDNLVAYIHLKESRQRINYNQLSTGIRNFIFRVGHIYSLYLNRRVQRGYVLLDEPENSLFPDFLYDIIDTYTSLLVDSHEQSNSQLFVSTHNPIIAAQFEPYERIVLEWDESGFVNAHKGSAPIGDDPNDVLRKDFGIENLMGRKGQEMWEEYLRLRIKLRSEQDIEKKKKLVALINKIGNEYNFEE